MRGNQRGMYYPDSKSIERVTELTRLEEHSRQSRGLAPIPPVEHTPTLAVDDATARSIVAYVAHVCLRDMLTHHYDHEALKGLTADQIAAAIAEALA